MPPSHVFILTSPQGVAPVSMLVAAETIGFQTGGVPGGDIVGIQRLKECQWGGDPNNATEYLFQEAGVHINRWSRRMRSRTLGQAALPPQSPRTRTFVTGRPHIPPEPKRRLAKRVTSVSISSKRGDIIRYHVESVRCGSACSAYRVRA